MAKVYEIQFGCRNDAEILKVQLRGLVNHLEGVHDHWRVCCIEKPTILSRECRMNHPKKPFYPDPNLDKKTVVLGNPSEETGLRLYHFHV